MSTQTHEAASASHADSTGAVVFSRTDAHHGQLALRPVDPGRDAELLHEWVTHPRSVYWQMQDADVDEVRRQYADIDSSPLHDAFVGLRDGRPEFLVERYDPAGDPIAEAYQVRPGDVGMHFLVAPARHPRHGFTHAVLVTVMEMLFADPSCERVVVEPDARNRRVHALNAAVGFTVAAEVRLPTKRALLSFCTREQFLAARNGVRTSAPQDLSSHLAPDTWARANRHLVRKALAELSHERLLEPEVTDGSYVVRSDDGTVEYRFSARLMALDHWLIDPDSIVRTVAGREQPLDAMALVLELRESLDLTDEILPVYLEEIASTLASHAFRLTGPAPTAAELVHADFQTVESSMPEGHPGFVANNGRLGFDAAEYRAYAPEAAEPVRLVWLAALRDRAKFTSVNGLDAETLISTQLSEAELQRFSQVLRGVGLELDDVHLIPVHPWQWVNRIAVTFAADIAQRQLVCLGHGADDYHAQQSIRTFFDVTEPSRHYVKTALSILNMGFLRGLSAAYMAATPAINDWLSDLVERDEVLQEAGFTLLREVAAVGYTDDHYAAAASKGSPYLKMLAALWRESPVTKVESDENLATMASLLHVDRDGRSLAAALIDESGLEPTDWLRKYLDAYLVPLVHSVFAYDLAFMPHGENVILVLKDGVPQRVIMKDLAEEVVVMGDLPLPTEVERIRADVPEDARALAVFTDVFDCFLRFLSAVMDDQGVLREEAFWRTVAECIADYQQATPHLAEAFARYDLFADEFELSCLNRLQLKNNRQMVDLEDQASSIQIVGMLANPIARRAPSASPES